MGSISIQNNKLPQDAKNSKWTSAVCFLLVGDSVAIIRRSDSMPSHKGQLAFIGGHRNPSENSPIDTAKREFFEESSLLAEDLEVHGLLPSVQTNYGKVIVPVLLEYKKSKSYFLDNATSNGEWEDLILVPLSYLGDLNLWKTGRCFTSIEYDILFLPIIRGNFQSYQGHYESHHLLWGATARMIWSFFQIYGSSART